MGGSVGAYPPNRLPTFGLTALARHTIIRPLLARHGADMSSVLPYPKPALPDDLRRQIDRLSPDERIEVLRALLGEATCRQLGIYPIPPGFKLTVVMPVFNERSWLAE